MRLVVGGSEGDAAEYLGETGFADDGELFLSCFGGVGVGDVVDDGDEAVGIGSLVSAAADGGGDAVDYDVAEDISRAGDVADAVGCGRPGKSGGGVVAGWVVIDGVGNAEFEASLQCIGEVPGLCGGVEDPLLNTCGGLGGGVSVEGGAAGDRRPRLRRRGCQRWQTRCRREKQLSWRSLQARWGSRRGCRCCWAGRSGDLLPTG